jgi:hypothetical protein
MKKTWRRKSRVRLPLIAFCVIALGGQDVQLPFQRMYAVINIFKGIHRRFGEGVESKLIKMEAR